MPMNTTTATDPVCRTAEALTEALPRRSWLAAKGYFRPCMLRSTNYAISLLEKTFNLSAVFYFPLIIRVKRAEGFDFSTLQHRSAARATVGRQSRRLECRSLELARQSRLLKRLSKVAVGFTPRLKGLKGLKIKPFSPFYSDYQGKIKDG